MINRFFVTLVTLLSAASLSALPQKDDKAVFLNYRFSPGQLIKTNTQVFKLLRTTADGVVTTSFGESVFHINQNILSTSDGRTSCEYTIEPERVSENGLDLSYELKQYWKDVSIRGAVTKNGFVEDGALEVFSIGEKSHIARESLIFVKNSLVALPDYPVRAGDSWTLSQVFTTEDLEAVLGSEFNEFEPVLDGKYRIEEIDSDKEIVRIGLSAELVSAGTKDFVIETSSYPVDIEIIGNIVGAFLFDYDDGRLLEGQIKMTFESTASAGDLPISMTGELNVLYRIER